LIEHLKRFPIEGIILDMRRNGGGLLTEAVKLVGLFLNNASVVQVRGSDLNNCLYADADGCAWDGPLLVLTSRFSASAAEIAAGALQVMRRALLFGAPTTHGKGSVQAMIEMDKLPLLSRHAPLGAAKLTIQKWYLPDGSSIQRRGVRPDIAKTSISDCLPVSESDSPHALPWDCIEPMSPKVSPSLSGRWLRAGMLQFLLQQQHAREAKRPYFDWHQRQAELFAKRYKQTEYSLNLKDRIVRINEERRLSKALADGEKTFLPLRYGYRLLTLGDAPHKSGKTKKPVFDFFEREALDIMTDWVVALHIVPQFSLWCYAKKRLF
jgi:carboxyl-terminal processing protease